MAMGIKSVDSMYRATERANNVPTFVYPHEMGEQSFYPESIKFTVYKRESASYQRIMKAIEKEWEIFVDTEGKGGLLSKTTGGLREELDKRRTPVKKAAEESNAERTVAHVAEDAIGRIQKIWDDSLLKEMMDFFKGVAPELVRGLNQRHIDRSQGLQRCHIFMNMPNEISFSEDVGWEGSDLGLIGSLTKTGGSMMQTGGLSSVGAMVGGGTGAIGGMIANILGVKNLNPIVTGLIGSLGGGTAQKAGEVAFGNIANPYKEMTFSGIGFRNFSFNFVFRARSEDEVNVVQSIIETFRYYSKPTYNQGISGLNYPEEFHIQFLTKPENQEGKTSLDRFETNEYIPQIKMCVCKAVNTNFSSQATWRALKTGAPVEISLGLSFEETELVTAEDVIGEGRIGRFSGRGKF